MTEEKAAFYLRHRRAIEEWAALRADAARLVDQALMTRFSDWSGEVDGTLRSTADLREGSWPRVYCSRLLWRERGLRLGVVLEWNRSRLLGGSRSPYLGVRAPAEQPLGRVVRDLLKAQQPALREVGLTQTSSYWPAWRWVDVPEDVDDLPHYAGRCADELERTWSELQVLLDGVAQAALAQD